MGFKKIFPKYFLYFQARRNENLVKKCRVYSTSQSGLVNIKAQLSDSDAMFKVDLGSLKQYDYPYPWLRDNCQCSECFHKGSQSRTLNWDEFDVHVKPVNFEVRTQ